MCFNPNFLPYFAKNILDIIYACEGKINKCLILDLDNTLWGGIIGDDGIENIELGDLGIGKAFSEFQLWIKELKERGVVLAICSKNEMHIAKEPFKKHPEMVLSLDDIAVFVANWNNKADNIRHIKKILNVGFDSMVFIDDNPFERSQVKTEIPEITIPDLPEDPAEYLSYLKSLNLFETASSSGLDKKRTKQYQEESKRVDFKENFSSIDTYLKSLNMIAEVSFFDQFNKPRIAQLTQRSNQFNLRTIRYSEKEIQSIIDSKKHIGLYVKLKDTFGDYGLISLAILEKKDSCFFIDSWIMSCRVLKRGVEQLLLDIIINIAKDNNIYELKGVYIPTAKNILVKDLYRSLRFKKVNDYWTLKFNSQKNREKHHIKLAKL